MSVYTIFNEGLFDNEEKQFKELLLRKIFRVANVLRDYYYNVDGSLNKAFEKQLRQTIEPLFDYVYMAEPLHRNIQFNNGVKRDIYLQYVCGIKNGHYYNFAISHYDTAVVIFNFDPGKLNTKVPIEVFNYAIEISRQRRSVVLTLYPNKIEFIGIWEYKYDYQKVFDDYCDYIQENYGDRCKFKINVAQCTVTVSR